MTVSLIRIDQLHKPDAFDDQLAAATIAGIESSALDYHDISNALISQLKRIMKGDSAGDWKDNPNGIDLTTLDNRPNPATLMAIFWRLNLTDVSVPASQNWVLLASAGQPPNRNIAISGSTKGAVVGQLPGAIGSHSLVESAGSNALKPKSLVAVFDAATGDAITSGDRRIWGLLQVGSTATDGNAFTLTGADEGQISFVRANAAYDDLEACPVADIESKSIIFAFSNRNDISNHTEDEWRGDIADADPSPGVLVSLDSAYDGGYFMSVDGSDVDIRLSDTKSWIFRKAGGNILFQVKRTDAGTADEVIIGADVDTFDNNAANSDFAEGATFDSNGQSINVGKTAVGVIDSATLETRATTGDNLVSAADDVLFKTVRQTTAIPLDDATAGPISALDGGPYASVSAAIKAALASGGVALESKVFIAGSAYGQGVNIPAATLDLSAYSLDMNTPAGVTLFLFLNGRLLHGGNGTTKNDVYAGTTPANGDIMVDFPGGIHTGDVIISIGLK